MGLGKSCKSLFWHHIDCRFPFFGVHGNAVKSGIHHSLGNDKTGILPAHQLAAQSEQTCTHWAAFLAGAFFPVGFQLGSRSMADGAFPGGILHSIERAVFVKQGLQGFRIIALDLILVHCTAGPGKYIALGIRVKQVFCGAGRHPHGQV